MTDKASASMSAQQTPGPLRAYITKSKRGHYTVTLRDKQTGQLVYIQDKLNHIQSARAIIARFREGGAA